MKGCSIWIGIMFVLYLLATATGGGGVFGTALGLMLGVSIPIAIGVLGAIARGKFD